MDIFKEIAALMGKAEIADMEQAIREGRSMCWRRYTYLTPVRMYL